jgi:hypothetical protein
LTQESNWSRLVGRGTAGPAKRSSESDFDSGSPFYRTQTDYPGYFVRRCIQDMYRGSNVKLVSALVVPACV